MRVNSWVFAVALAFVAAPAAADLTAEEVLADQLNLLSGYGLIEMTTTGTARKSNGLTVEGFLGTYSEDDKDGEVQVRISGVDLVEQADGTVRIDYPETVEISVASTMADEPNEVVFTFEFEGMSHVVSESDTNSGDALLQHDIAFDKAVLGDFAITPPPSAEQAEVTVELSGVDTTLMFADGDDAARNLRFNVDAMTLAMDVTLPDGIEGVEAALPNDQSSDFEAVTMVMNLTNAAGSVGYRGGDIPNHTADFRFDLFEWSQNMQADGIDGMDFKMLAEDFALSYDIAMSIEAMEASPVDALQQGQQASGAMSYTRMEYDFDIVTPEGPIGMRSSNGLANAEFGFDQNGIRISSSALDTKAEVSGPMDDVFPLGTMGYTVKSAEVDIAMPILPSDGTRPFALKLAIEGVETAEEVWALFDPEKRIPRDPIDLVIDMEGEAVVTSDVFADDTQMPFQNSNVTLNAFRLALGGAVLTGEGSVRDTSTPGNPRGVGTLNSRLTGANTLLDTLVDMGLLPSEQAMAARMGLGLVARAGDGPDTLVSTIEIKEDGSILANGQRIK